MSEPLDSLTIARLKATQQQVMADALHMACRYCTTNGMDDDLSAWCPVMPPPRPHASSIPTRPARAPEDDRFVTRIEAIKIIVAETWGVPVKTMDSQRRYRRLAWPRQVAMSICDDLLPQLSLPQIGRKFGNRDHTTVMHARRAVVERCDPAHRRYNPEFADMYGIAMSRCREAIEAGP
jgi:hypothetical protein